MDHRLPNSCAVPREQPCSYIYGQHPCRDRISSHLRQSLHPCYCPWTPVLQPSATRATAKQPSIADATKRSGLFSIRSASKYLLSIRQNFFKRLYEISPPLVAVNQTMNSCPKLPCLPCSEKNRLHVPQCTGYIVVISLPRIRAILNDSFPNCNCLIWPDRSNAVGHQPIDISDMLITAVYAQFACSLALFNRPLVE